MNYHLSLTIGSSQALKLKQNPTGRESWLLSTRSLQRALVHHVHHLIPIVLALSARPPSALPVLYTVLWTLLSDWRQHGEMLNNRAFSHLQEGRVRVVKLCNRYSALSHLRIPASPLHLDIITTHYHPFVSVS